MKIFIVIYYTECESKTSVRLCEYEIYFIADIGCGHLLCWYRILILPWYKWPTKYRSPSGFLLGVYRVDRIVPIRKCYTCIGDKLDSIIVEESESIIFVVRFNGT